MGLCGENDSLSLAERANHLDFGSAHNVDLDLNSSRSGAFKHITKRRVPTTRIARCGTMSASSLLRVVIVNLRWGHRMAGRRSAQVAESVTSACAVSLRHRLKRMPELGYRDGQMSPPSLTAPLRRAHRRAH